MGLTKLKIEHLSYIVDNKCEQCKEKKKLEPHRIKRGNQGGNYNHRNVKMLCNDCHKMIHANEPGVYGR